MYKIYTERNIGIYGIHNKQTKLTFTQRYPESLMGKQGGHLKKKVKRIQKMP